ncbi:C40 family peptidase [Jongsikchunia kroppenstedtii]|uniref:C40 family peptidase n=1 Tax=Jongsikchunia kroppenstedtii TaxID=1121721 RepID=UPI000362F8C8|nr:C40 family peptidase [Jongsikchunia kroppenstedtii]
MIPIELLLAPIRALIAAFGTGALPAGHTAALRSTATTLSDSASRLTQADGTAAAGWAADGQRAASLVIRRSRDHSAALGDDSSDLADAYDRSAEIVRRGAADLEAIAQSFIGIAAAMGPTLFTGPGLASILPVATEHLQRAMRVVERVRAELQPEIDRVTRIAGGSDPRLAQLGRLGGELDRFARAFGPGGTAPGTTPSAGGVAVTLPDGSTVYAPNERAATAVRAALTKQGLPYVWGGTDPNSGFDCSGFTQWAYRQAGVELPRLAQEQDSAGVPVSQSDLMPGDLAVWDGHVAMYVGNGKLIETGGDPVGITALRTTNAGQGFQGFFRPSTQSASS